MWVYLLLRWGVAAAPALIAMALTLPMEILWPRSPVPLEARLRGIAYYLLIVVPIAVGFGTIESLLSWNMKPIVPASAWTHHPILTVAGTLIVYDLGFYVMHRLEHRFFWRVHSVHHSIENLGTANSYNHPLQAVFDWLMIFLPLNLLGLGPGLVLSTLATIQGFYLHTATRLNLGPLRWLVNDNRHHRIHHSREREHWDKNYALFFPFWDLVFGTAHMHEPDAWPATGVHDVPEARSILQFIAQPALPRSRALH